MAVCRFANQVQSFKESVWEREQGFKERKERELCVYR